MSVQDDEKKAAGRAGADLIEDGMIVGLGTGSTSAHVVRRLGERIASEGLRVRAVCTSMATEKLAKECGIEIEPARDQRLDLYLDGADQIDGQGRMIKGGGGALLWEKIVATMAAYRVIVVDSSKAVATLGKGFAVPVEIVKFAHESHIAALARIPHCRPVLRLRDGKPFVTDEGHLIADCHFADGLADAEAFASATRQIPGVVENGLFFGLCDLLIIGKGSSTETREFKKS